MNGMVRRVVTGHDKNGRSVVISDAPAPYVHTIAQRPDYYSTDIFRTHGTPAVVEMDTKETTLGPRRQLPTPKGSVLRVNCFPPDSESVTNLDAQGSQALFASLGNQTASTFAKSGRHPLMHQTETIDYAIVLSGQITMLLDDSDVVLNAGDILVQCGTNHAWSNRSYAPAVVAFILIDGQYDPDLKALLDKTQA